MSDFFTPKGHISTQKIREELLALQLKDGEKINEEQVGEIIDLFWFKDYYYCFISIPEVFEKLKVFLVDHGVKFKRIDFYKYYFSQLLDSSEQWELLQKLGVAFEIAQTDKLLPELFKKVVQEFGSTSVNIDWALENNLIWENEGELKWRHHAITEFFAANFIEQQDNYSYWLNSLMVLRLEENESDNIKPSWANVIGFLLESNKSIEVLEWLIKLIESNPLNLSENLSDILVTFSPSDIPSKLKVRVFNAIYDTFQERMVWLPVWARHGLARFYTSGQLPKLESHLKATDDPVQTYVYRGNVVAVVSKLIEEQVISDKKAVATWKERFVEYALDDNDNGVLQRHSLHALSQFKENNGEVILKLRKNLNSTDSLVREAFIQYCYESAPNTKESIDVMIEGILGGSSIYGRRGLYAITEVNGFEYLLQQFVGNHDFYSEFLDDESIFSGDRKEGDQEFVKAILTHASRKEKIESLLQQLITQTITSERIYQIKESYFIRKIAQYMAQNIKNVFGWIDQISNYTDEGDRRFGLYNIKDLLAEVLTETNWEQIYDRLGLIEEEHVDRYRENMIYALRFRKTPGGQELFELAAKKLKLEIPDEKKYEQEQSKRDDEIYKEFKFKLEPAPKQFITDVFDYFLDNKDLIINRWSEHEKKRMIFLSYEDGLKRLNPRDFTVSFEEKGVRSSSFRWSQQAAYYGKLIKIVELLKPAAFSEKKVRQHIIDFIPYCYSDDQQTVEKIITTIKPSELKWINSLFKNADDDRRYLVPSSYVEFIDHLLKKHQNIQSSANTLESFLLDDGIDKWVSKHALKILRKIRKPGTRYKGLLLSVFRQSDNFDLKSEANKQLIQLYRDSAAINWRFEKLSERMAPFERDRSFGFHEVGALENELDSKSFIAPLTSVTNEQVSQLFYELLDKVAAAYQEDSKYSSYFDYVWNALVSHIFSYEDDLVLSQVETAKAWINASSLGSRKEIFLRYSLDNLIRDFVNKLAVKGGSKI